MDFRKNKILSRAAILMSQVGFEKFTIKALADRLSTKPASILYHFKNKTELFEGIVLKTIEDGRALIDQQLKKCPHKGLAEVEVWVEAHYDWLEKLPYRQTIIFIFYAQSIKNKRLQELNASIIKAGQLRILEILKRARLAKEIAPANIESLALQLHSLLTAQIVYMCSAGRFTESKSFGREHTLQFAKLLLSHVPGAAKLEPKSSSQ